MAKQKSKSKRKSKPQTNNAKGKKAQTKKVGRLVATTEYFRDLKKPVTKAEAIKATNAIHFKSGGTDNEPEQKFSVNRMITAMVILGYLTVDEKGLITPTGKK